MVAGEEELMRREKEGFQSCCDVCASRGRKREMQGAKQRQQQQQQH